MIDILHEPATPPKPSYWDELLSVLHLKKEPVKHALSLGILYSRLVDNWGVELERSGHIIEAGKVFDQAGQLNPFNASASLNKGFNNKLVAGKEILVQPPKDLEEKYLGQHRNLVETINQDGPIDEPNCRDDLAVYFGGSGNIRQCAQNLDRIREIAPNNLRIPLQLAQLMVYIQSSRVGLFELMPYQQCYSIAYTNAEIVLHKIPNEPTALFLKSVSLIQMEAYERALQPLNQLISLQSTNYSARLNRGIANFKLGNYAPSKTDYEYVQKAIPAVYQASFGLAKIAEEEHDKTAAIKNYEIYLTHAPTNTPEAHAVTAAAEGTQGRRTRAMISIGCASRTSSPG